MLTMNLIKDCHTIEDMRNLLVLSNSMYKEQSDTDVPSINAGCYTIGGTQYPHLSYAISSERNGYIGKNFFMTCETEKSPKGIVYTNHGSTDIVELIPEEYVKFNMIHQECWTALRYDTTYDLFIHGEKVVDGILSTDLLELARILWFLQVDTCEYRSLVCVNRDNLAKGVFCPQSEADFDVWFETQVAHLGYNGSLDMCAISDLFRVYYEVKSCIFVNGNFRPITIA